MDYGDPRLPQRFWDKVYPCPLTGCWLWGGARHSTLPYGIWTERTKKTARAHVSVFVASGGAVTIAKPHVLHSCDQAPCVRPEHLRAGTHVENMADARERQRHQPGRRSSLTVADVVSIRERYAAREPSESIAGDVGLAKATISLIVRGLIWKNAGGPLTFGRKLGSPSPAREKETCKYGHRLTPDNVRLKPNPQCRSGYERQCITCRRRINQELAARRKADRAIAREQRTA